MSTESRLMQISYTSWMDLLLSDYNSDLFCQPRDYLAECYRQGEILN